MKKNSVEIHTGILLDENSVFTLTELSQSCGVEAEIIIEMVEYGILEPQGDVPVKWVFPVEALKRSKVTLHLQRDLGINLSGAALAIELLEKINLLEQQLSHLR